MKTTRIICKDGETMTFNDASGLDPEQQAVLASKQRPQSVPNNPFVAVGDNEDCYQRRNQWLENAWRDPASGSGQGGNT